MKKILHKNKKMQMISAILSVSLSTNLLVSDYLIKTVRAEVENQTTGVATEKQCINAATENPNTTTVDKYIPDTVLLNILRELADANKDGKLTIAELRDYTGDSSGKLDLKDKGITNIQGLGYAKSVKSIDLSGNNSITKVPDETFKDCNKLVSIKIPDSITTIGVSAFDGCLLLSSINLPEGLATISEKAFLQCDSLTNIKLPDNIASIGDSAFSASGLTSIVIPNTTVNLGISIFNGCRSLTNVKLLEGMTVIPAETFKATGMTGITLPSTIKVIEAGAFMKSSLVSIDLTSCTNLESIKKSAFAATPLISINIPETVTEIGESAFESCNLLPSITLPSKITVIDTKTFKDCYSLKAVYFAQAVRGDGSKTYNLKEIKSAAFYNCIRLGDSSGNVNFLVNLDQLTIVGEQVFAYSKDIYDKKVNYGMKCFTFPKSLTTLGKDVFSYCYSLNSITIPDKVTEIPDEAFLYCDNLKNVTLSNALVTIGTYSFRYCYSLNDISFPDTLTKIGNNAFEGCAKQYVSSTKQYTYTGITALNLPDNLKEIGTSAFKNCFNLEGVKLPLKLETIPDYLFDGCGLSITDSNKKVTYKGIATITLPNAYKTIGNSAFRGCYNLSLGNGKFIDTLETIGNSAFENCKSITTVVFPDSLKSIGSSAFNNCSSLTIVNFDATEKLTTMGSSAFANADVTDILRFPNELNLKRIESSVFYNNKNMISVILPAKVNFIGSSSFGNCVKLETVEMPAAASVNSSAFSGCEIFTNAKLMPVPSTFSVIRTKQVKLPVYCFTTINDVVVDNEEIATASISTDSKSVTITGATKGETKATVKGTIEYQTSTKDPVTGTYYINRFETEVAFDLEVTGPDLTGPGVLSITPNNKKEDVAVTDPIVIEFSEPVKMVSSSGIVLTDSKAQIISGTYQFEDSSDPRKLILTPKSLDPGTKYTLAIAAEAITDLNGNLLKGAFSSTFKTILLPTVTSSTPTASSTTAKTNSVIKLTFNEEVLKGDEFEVIKLLDVNKKAVDFTTSFDKKVLQITPVDGLTENTQYTLTIPKNAIKDSLERIMPKDYTLTFKTAVDKTAPTVVSTTPKKNAKDATVDTKITVTFSEKIKIQDSTVTSKVSLVDSKKNKVGIASIVAEKNTLIITPKENLSPGTKYTLTIDKGALKDDADTPNLFKSKYTLSFATGS